MARIRFTQNLTRFIETSEIVAAGRTVAGVFQDACAQRPVLRDWVLDDQGGLRPHMSLFVDGTQIRDRRQLSDPVADDSVIDIIQALSGG
jgi:molybdopterin synthase sulfur carrier subunit